MENHLLVNECGNLEEFIKTRNLLLGMDYDSGYISHKSESNFDTSMENIGNLIPAKSPIYFSEDALLETPELGKYPDAGLQSEIANSEDPRIIFNSPIPSNITHVSGSTESNRSQLINYSDFDLSDSKISPVVPCAKHIVVSVENTKNMDIKDENKKTYINLQNRHTVFNNITNTLATVDPLKKLTLVLTKNDKENAYSVKRKYCSLSPQNDSIRNDNDSTQCDESSISIMSCEEDISLKVNEDNKYLLDNSLYDDNMSFEENFSFETNLHDQVNCNVEVANNETDFNNQSLELKSIEDLDNVVAETLEYILNNLHEYSNVSEEMNQIVQGTLDISSKPSPTETSHLNKTNSIAAQTPTKPILNENISGLSPDLFDEDQDEEVQEESKSLTFIPKERYIVKKDNLILQRVQNNLKGIIPPRSVTVIKMPVLEMLNKIKSNKKYFWCTSTVNKSQEENDSKSLLITSSLEDCKKEMFPSVLRERCLGLYHNRSKLSEEFEELCMKYGQRYVGAETQSSCTVFEVYSSPVKRRNIKSQWNTKSPGKRLSHLARRRITFSSANLQTGSSFLAGSRARQILVDAKKMDFLNKRKSPRKSPRKTPKKTPGKSPRIKTRTPSSSAKKKLALRFRKVTGEIEKSATKSSIDSTKRTLFNSPDDGKKLGNLMPSTSAATKENDFKKSTSKRALFLSPSKSSPLKNLGFRRSPVKRLDFGLEKKRKRTDSDSCDGVISKLPRCHSEIIPSNELNVKSLVSRTQSEFNLSQNRQIKELTTNHKKKLQLAIYEALRSQNVLPTHPQFKIFASNLGRLTKKLFLMTTVDSIGVTEKMLRIARHHVFSVIKGKTPEEIYEEFIKQKSKNLKPQGYVAPDNLPSYKLLENNLIYPEKSLNTENKIERIRKAINFGDDDNR